MYSDRLVRSSESGVPGVFCVISRSGRLLAGLFILVLFFVFASIQTSYAQVVAIGAKGFVACTVQQRLEVLMNLLKVGETSISTIYYKKLILQKECIPLQLGEKINITSESNNPEIIRIIRLSDNKSYYVSRDPLKIGE